MSDGTKAANISQSDDGSILWIGATNKKGVMLQVGFSSNSFWLDRVTSDGRRTNVRSGHWVS